MYENIISLINTFNTSPWKIFEAMKWCCHLHAPTTIVLWSAEKLMEGTVGDTVVDISEKYTSSNQRPELSHSKSEESSFFLPCLISESLQNFSWVNWTSVTTHILVLTKQRIHCCHQWMDTESYYGEGLAHEY